jgi:hypothetical protein
MRRAPLLLWLCKLVLPCLRRRRRVMQGLGHRKLLRVQGLLRLQLRFDPRLLGFRHDHIHLSLFDGHSAEEGGDDQDQDEHRLQIKLEQAAAVIGSGAIATSMPRRRKEGKSWPSSARATLAACSSG